MNDLLDDVPADVLANNASLHGFRNDSMQLLLLIFIFVAIFYVLYLVYKYFLPGGNRRGLSFGKSRNMKVLEITSVGPGSTIQLVKVSEEYFLVGVTKAQITFLTKLDPTSVESGYEAIESDNEKRPKFIDVFSNVVKKKD